jgi:hypothetical protein
MGHGPLPQTPSTLVYFDRKFGGFIEPAFRSRRQNEVASKADRLTPSRRKGLACPADSAV